MKHVNADSRRMRNLIAFNCIIPVAQFGLPTITGSTAGLFKGLIFDC